MIESSVWGVFSYSITSISESAKKIVGGMVGRLDHLLEKIAEGAKNLGRNMPAHRDFSNFSSDPKFWEKIFFTRFRICFSKICL